MDWIKTIHAEIKKWPWSIEVRRFSNWVEFNPWDHPAVAKHPKNFDTILGLSSINLRNTVADIKKILFWPHYNKEWHLNLTSHRKIFDINWEVINYSFRRTLHQSALHDLFHIINNQWEPPFIKESLHWLNKIKEIAWNNYSDTLDSFIYQWLFPKKMIVDEFTTKYIEYINFDVKRFLKFSNSISLSKEWELTTLSLSEFNGLFNKKIKNSKAYTQTNYNAKLTVGSIQKEQIKILKEICTYNTIDDIQKFLIDNIKHINPSLQKYITLWGIKYFTNEEEFINTIIELIYQISFNKVFHEKHIRELYSDWWDISLRFPLADTDDNIMLYYNSLTTLQLIYHRMNQKNDLIYS